MFGRKAQQIRDLESQVVELQNDLHRLEKKFQATLDYSGLVIDFQKSNRTEAKYVVMTPEEYANRHTSNLQIAMQNAGWFNAPTLGGGI